MKNNLDEALQAVFMSSNIPDAIIQKIKQGEPVGTIISSRAQEALDHYNKAMDYLKQANWAAYGKELEQLKAILSEMTKHNPGN